VDRLATGHAQKSAADLPAGKHLCGTLGSRRPTLRLSANRSRLALFYDAQLDLTFSTSAAKLLGKMR
jgi:hypothetical protein